MGRGSRRISVDFDDEGWNLPCSIFGVLRSEWCRQGSDDEQRTYAQLADLLDVHPVSVSQWSVERRAPWRAVRRLLVETGARVVLSPHGFEVVVEDDEEENDGLS